MTKLLGSTQDKLLLHPVYLSLVVACFLVLPGVSYDTTNLPRLVAIIFIASLTWTPLFQKVYDRHNRQLMGRREVYALFLILMYFLVALVTSSLNETSNSIDWFGDFGRSTGLFAYVALFSIFLTSVYVSQISETQGFHFFIRTLFQISLIYAALQLFEFDPIDWDNPFGSQSLGTFGNPNFQSIFLAIVSLFFAAHSLINIKARKAQTIANFICFLISVLLLFQNPSIQGMIAFLLGFLVLLISRASIAGRKLFIFVGFGITIAGVILFAQIISRGYYQSIPFLAQNLQFRVLVWKASFSIAIDRPFIGTGFDSLGSWFQEYRDVELSRAYDRLTNADAAHNIFLDQAINGGILLLLCYSGIFFLVTYSATKCFLSRKKMTANFSFLLSTWIVFCFHHLFSINQLGIAIIGFVLGGLLLGESLELKSEKTEKRYRKSLLVKIILPMLISIGPLAVLTKDMAYLRALESGDGLRLIEVSSRWPKNDFYVARSAEILYNNSYDQLGRVEAEKALIVNPRNIVSLRLLVEDENVPSLRKNQILATLKRVDPLSFEMAVNKKD